MFLSLGVDHTRADLAVRERVHIDEADIEAVVTRMSAAGAEEPIVTRTCNRIEAYCWWPHPHPSTAVQLGSAGWSLAMAWADMDPRRADLLLRHGKLRRGGDAVRHLLRVSAGLESQVLGDIHILGQLRRAFIEAADAGWIGPHMHRLFESALRLGKQVRRETHFMSTCSGVGSEAARYALHARGSLAGQRCLVVGSGKIATQAARKLQVLGARDIAVANRTLHRAQALVDSLGEGRAHDMDTLSACVAEADVVIVATGAPEPVLTPAHVRDADDLLVIDLSVPRNVDRSVALVPGATLVDLDALHPERDAAERSKLSAVPAVEAMVEASAVQVEEWIELALARRSLQPFQRTLLAACERELTRLDCDAPDASRTAERIVARVMASPMSVLRDACQQGDTLDPSTFDFETLFAAPQHAEV